MTKRPTWVAGLVLAIATTGIGCAGGSGTVPNALRPWVAVGAVSIEPDLSAARVELERDTPVQAVSESGDVVVHEHGLAIPLRFAAEGAQSVSVAVHAGEHIGDIELRYYPRSFYIELESSQPSTLLLFTTLPRVPTQPRGETAGAGRAPEESLFVHGHRWEQARRDGRIPTVASAPEDELLELFEHFDRTNDPSVGRLCDEHRPGIEVANAMAARECFVWCTGYSLITRDFFRSLRIPARLVDLTAYAGTLPGEILLQSSEAHQTTEVWDSSKWVWVDATMRVLGATDPEGNRLSARETLDALSDRHSRDEVHFIRFERGTRSWVSRPLRDQDDDFKSMLSATMTADKAINVPNEGRG